MISNERQSPFSSHSVSQSAPRANVVEETLRSERIQIERKTFIFTLKENPRGRFLRITEDVAGRRDTIIIPATGLEDFRKQVESMIQSAEGLPLNPVQEEDGPSS